MAPKKIDAAKRGDVSMAQFVYDGDADQSLPASTLPQLKTTTPSAATPATQMETDDPAEPSLLADREKDKERERKDKDKDSSKEPVTLEVWTADLGSRGFGSVCFLRYPAYWLTDRHCDQDLTLPKSIITRLAKGVLPSNTQIQANAILAMSKSATVFINHLANAYVSISAHGPPSPWPTEMAVC